MVSIKFNEHHKWIKAAWIWFINEYIDIYGIPLTYKQMKTVRAE